MRDKKTLKISLFLTIAMAGLFFILSFTNVTEEKVEKECLEQCCMENKEPGKTGEMIWESLPRQFFSSINISR